MAIIRNLRVEHGTRSKPVGVSRPRLSWELEGSDGAQLAYEICVTGDGRPAFSTGKQPGLSSSFIEWPAPSLQSREIVVVKARVWTGREQPSKWSEPLTVEATLLEPSDWVSGFISPSLEEPHNGARRGYLLRAGFQVTLSSVRRARVYATAHGMYELEINGSAAGDELFAPGWTSYEHRLRFQTYDVTHLLEDGHNAIGAWLADGWYRGRLGFHGGRWDNYGTDIALLAQLELTHADGSVTVVPLDSAWRWSRAPIVSTGIYEGESFDAQAVQPGWSRSEFSDHDWHLPATIPIAEFPAQLVPPTGPGVSVTQTLQPVSVQRRPNGRIRLDFGQNIAGRLRFKLTGYPGLTISLHHAEVLEHDELSIRPLRTAAAIDRYTFRSSQPEEWAPRFTYHGFRYAEIEGWAGSVEELDVVAEVIHTNVERSGWFESSHALLNKLHENTVWGMRGNFVDIPTDCPQRDERLGWTGDIQVFAPAALYLFHSAGTLSGWLRDLAVEQRKYGSVPNFVPWIECGFPSAPAAAWGDAAVIVPWTIYERTGDTKILADQFESMRAWVDLVESLSNGNGLWDRGFQLGDWLDPASPPDHPGESHTDSHLVATAYFARSAKVLAATADVLGDDAAHAHYERLHRLVKAAFQEEYVSKSGRVVSDTQSALALAIVFDLFVNDTQREYAGARLKELVIDSGHRVQTGFVGTPIICDALAQVGAIETAYHLLLQEEMPSWLYPVKMGATTIWERWDSMLPNGEVNPGEMTSFNHYALGAVVDFLHRVVAGLAPGKPGYREIIVQPQPGGGLEHASARHLTPQGLAEVGWRRVGSTLVVDVIVPAGTSARVRLPGDDWQEVTVGSGSHRFEAAFPMVSEDAVRPERHDPHARVQPEPV
jgi:alpha-L-rhamnosidase